MFPPRIYGALIEPDDDQRHYSFAAVRQAISSCHSTAESVDWRRFSSPRHAQSHSGSCTAQAAAKALEMKRIKRFYDLAIADGMGEGAAIVHAHKQHIDVARLGIYALSRVLMGIDGRDGKPWITKDDGAYNSMAAEVLRRFGVGPENDFPFNLKNLFIEPNWRQMRRAYVRKISSWRKIYSKGQSRVEDVILALAAGNVVVFATEVDAFWRDYNRKSEPLGTSTGTMIGLHATVIVGWDPQKCVFICENSWGNNWGDDGYFYMVPDSIASSKSSDFIVYEGGYEDYLEAV